MYQVTPQQQVQPVQAGQISTQALQAIMAVIMAVWVATYVLSQMIKVFKGEEIEKPPLIPE